MYNIFQGGDRSSTLKKQQQRFVEILRKPFRRLSAPSSPILPPRSEGEGREEEKDTSQTTDSEKVCGGGGADDIDDDYDDRGGDDEITLIPTTLDSHSTSNSSPVDGGYTVVSLSHTLTLTTGKLTYMHIKKMFIVETICNCNLCFFVRAIVLIFIKWKWTYTHPTNASVGIFVISFLNNILCMLIILKLSK